MNQHYIKDPMDSNEIGRAEGVAGNNVKRAAFSDVQKFSPVPLSALLKEE
jgi:hypothetical protein